MAGKREIKTSLKLEGENQFKKGMTDAASAIKVLNSEQKLAAAQFEATGDAEQYAAEKARILKEKIAEQQKAVKNAEDAVRQLKADGIDPNSKAMQTWRTKLYNAKTALTRMENELNKTETELGNQGQAFDDATTDAVEYRDQLDKIGENVDFQATIQAIDNVRERLGSIITGAGRAAKSMWNLERGAAGWADELATNAQIADLDVEEYQGWLYASQMIDSSVDTIRGAYKRLGMKLDEPTDEILKSFNELGVANLDPLTNQARQTMDVFWDVVDALGAMENSSRRDQIAQELLGKSFDDLLPLINAGSEKYKEFVEIGKQKAVSAESIDNLTALDDSLLTLQTDFDQTRYSILSELAPAFESAAEAISGALQSFNDFLDSTEGQKQLDKLKEAIAGVADDISKIDWKDAMDKVTGVVTAFVDGLTWLLNHKTVVIAAITGMAGAWAGLSVAGDVLSVMQLLKDINWGQISTVAASGAANTAATGTGGASALNTLQTTGKSLSAGSLVLGTALNAGVAALFKQAADYRSQYGPIGSAEAIEKATEGNEELTEAFNAWIDTQREQQRLIDEGNIFGDEFAEAAQKAQQASESFFSMEGSENVKRLYNDLREIHGLSGMDWPEPDAVGFNSQLDAMVTGTEDAAADMQTTMESVDSETIGYNIGVGLANGISESIPLAVGASEALGNAVSGSLKWTLKERSPSKITEGIGENASVGLVIGLENKIGMIRKAAERMAHAASDVTITPPDIDPGYGMSRRGAAAYGAPVAGNGATPNPSGMVHVTLNLDGREVADVITPYVDSEIGAMIARRR